MATTQCIGIERNLPENRRRRVEQQLTDAQRQVRRLTETLWFANQALTTVYAPLPLAGLDACTRLQLEVTVKCLRADVASAQQLEDSAYRIYCEELGLDPNEGQEDGPDPVRDGWVGKDGRP